MIIFAKIKSLFAFMLKGKKIVIPEYIEYLDAILEHLSEVENTECKKEDLYEGVTGYKFKLNPSKDEKYGEFDPKNPSILVLSNKGIYDNQTLFEKSLTYLQGEGYIYKSDELIVITGKGLAKNHTFDFSADYRAQYTSNQESSTNLKQLETQTTLFWVVLIISGLTLISTIVDICLKLNPVEIPTKQKNQKHNCAYQTYSTKKDNKGKDSIHVIMSPLK